MAFWVFPLALSLAISAQDAELPPPNGTDVPSPDVPPINGTGVSADVAIDIPLTNVTDVPPDAPVTPKCTHPDDRGYLLWTGYKPEFNNQMITLAETILLNRALKDAGRGRVLVLTGFMELKDPGQGVNASDGLDYIIHPESHVLHPVDFALDVPQTMANLGIGDDEWIDLATFRNVCHSKITVEAHAFIHDWDEPNRLPPTGSTEESRTNYSIQEKIFPDDNPQAHPIPELADVVFPEARIIVHDPTVQIHLKKDLPRVYQGKLLVVDSLFYSGNLFTPSYAPRLGYDYFDIVGKFEFSLQVKRVMRQFRIATFGSLDVHYLAVHWRRGFHVAKAGDDNRESADVSYDLQQVADLAVERSQSVCPGCPIYIASNNISQSDVDTISQMMGTGQQVVSIMLNPPEIELNTLSRAEMLICVEAHTFIPSVTSTWSANVQAMRGLHISGPPPGKDGKDSKIALEHHPLRAGTHPFSSGSASKGTQANESAAVSDGSDDDDDRHDVLEAGSTGDGEQR